MKLLLRLLCVVALGFTTASAVAQCTTASLNWDALDYFPTAGYTGYASTATMSPNQSYAFGKNTVTITYSGVTSSGENASHTGETSSYGAGEDVQYNGNGTVTINFATAVSNVKFSVYDIDKGQVLAVSASNSGVPAAVTVAKANTTSTVISITGGTVTSTTGAEPENTNTTTVNVDVAGPVTSVTLTSTLTDTKNGGASDTKFWLSDIAACVTGSFPTNYYSVSQPFTGQPGYVLVSANKGVYMVNPANGNAKFIFDDGATSGTINSVAYDPVNKIIYYTWSLTNNGSANASEKTLRKYDMTTGTVSTVLNDINSLGIPTFDQGVESGAAAFYDGALYLGIEGGADNGNGGPKTTSNRESIIWRIDFNSSLVPTSATQVYAVNGDTHDWSDFSINDGLLYDFNGDATTPDYHHLNLQTGANLLVNYVTTTPKQSAVGWDGKVYWVSNQIAQYTSGSLGTKYTITATPAIPNFGTTGAPSFGDGAEAFRPKADFGDLPSTFEPDALSPALHEIDANLRLGATVVSEWSKRTSTNAYVNATDDGSDEDGLVIGQIMNLSGGKYQIDVKVFNNTGASATVAAWADFNGDGVFQTSEGTTQAVGTLTTTQTVQLYWTGIANNLAQNSYTYLRIRLTSATNSMTTANPTGYFANGEVEDYRVVVNTTPLSTSIVSFKAEKKGNTSVISWNAAEDKNKVVYELQRSADAMHWQTIASKNSVAANGLIDYEYIDQQPVPTSFYRIQFTDEAGVIKYTNVEKLLFPSIGGVQVFPNPAARSFVINLQASAQEHVVISITDFSGKSRYTSSVVLQEGWNSIPVKTENLSAGIYNIQVLKPSGNHTEKLIIQKN